MHHPLPRDQETVTQRYRAPDGMPHSVEVITPRIDNPTLLNQLQERRSGHKQVAGNLARQLRAIREQTEQRLRRQSEGRLDRRQLVNAAKGLDEVYTQTRELPRTSFAASLSVDLSGSMEHHLRSRALYDATMIMGDTFDMLEAPYEVRAFGSAEAQLKSIGDSTFAQERAACLAAYNMGGTQLGNTAGLAASSLMARQEHNKMMVVLSDGDVTDQQASAAALKEARRNGIVTFGIFLGNGANARSMDDLYGAGNWTIINELSDMPKAVGQRLATIFKRIR